MGNEVADKEQRSRRFHGLHGRWTRRRLATALAGVAALGLGDAAAKRARRHRKSTGRNGGRLAAEASPSRVRELTCSDGTTFLG